MSGCRLVVLVVPAAVLISVALIFIGRADRAVPTGVLHVTHNPRYATQSTSARLARQAHIAEVQDNNYDAGLETCSALGLRRLAQNMGVAANPVTAARRLANGWDPAFRESAYQGCLQALRGHGG